MSEFPVLSELLPTPARYLVLVPILVLVPGPVILQRRLVPEMRVCAGLSGPLVLSLVLVLVRGWEADLELLDLVEEVSQNFYEFLHLDKVSPTPCDPGPAPRHGSLRVLLPAVWESRTYTEPVRGLGGCGDFPWSSRQEAQVRDSVLENRFGSSSGPVPTAAEPLKTQKLRNIYCYY